MIYFSRIPELNFGTFDIICHLDDLVIGVRLMWVSIEFNVEENFYRREPGHTSPQDQHYQLLKKIEKILRGRD